MENMCFLHDIEKLRNFYEISMEKISLIKLPEWLVWRLYGESVKSNTFYGDFVAKLVWRITR